MDPAGTDLRPTQSAIDGRTVGVDERAGGWSVLAIGHAYEVRSISPEYANAAATLDAFWSAGERTDVVKITIEKIEGRRLHRPE